MIIKISTLFPGRFWENNFSKEVSIAPLALFRISFGLVLFVSMLRFISKGWVRTQYIQPKYFFHFYGFEWVHSYNAGTMYLFFVLMALAALCVSIGFLYRFSIISFFLLFTYVELIDKSNYLNHYYFISIIASLLCLVPAGRAYSLDVKFGWVKACTQVPAWCLTIFKLQLAIVYVYAGLAKVNYDWLMRAMPLRIWLPAKYDIPLIGYFLDELWVAYFFSWAGMLYDLLIPFILSWRRTVYIGIGLVIIFHILTAILFPLIGMFPFIMLMAALIFLPETFHERVLKQLNGILPVGAGNAVFDLNIKKITTKLFYGILILHFIIQILLPLRFLFYPGELFWTEEGYRFSWRVMLMEKAGYATFVVKDAASGYSETIDNRRYLTTQQEKMMSTQPDMILQFAKLLERDYREKGMKAPQVFVECYVTLNGKPSKLYIDPAVDLTKEKEGFEHKKWILPSGQK